MAKPDSLTATEIGLMCIITNKLLEDLNKLGFAKYILNHAWGRQAQAHPIVSAMDLYQRLLEARTKGVRDG